MALKDTLKWMTSEWAILASGDQMTLRDRARWISHWVPFGMRTVGYGSVSITLGPVTPDHQASLWAMKRWSS